MDNSRWQRSLPLSADGLSWLDIDGKLPALDLHGQLTTDFILVLPTKSERFTVGCVMPATAAALRLAAKHGSDSEPR